MIAQGEAWQGRETIWTFSATHFNRKWAFRNLGQWTMVPATVLILKFGTQDFTDPGVLKTRLTLTGLSLWFGLLKCFRWKRNGLTCGQRLLLKIRSLLKFPNCAFVSRISRGREKWKKYSSHFLPNRPRPRPRPLSSFDTHARWQPVTQSARSRWSYGKIDWWLWTV